jgi:hypothetical protein
MTATTTDPAATGRRPGLGDAFVLRVAGLPVETVRPLRCPDARDWAAGVLAETDRLAAAGAELSEPLAALVRAAGEADRRRLLALRRQVFGNTAPRDLDAALALAAGLPDPVGGTLGRWLADRRRLDERVAAGADLVAAELARTREELRALVAGEERLRAGLVLASPTLDGQLDAYLARTGPPDKRTRRIERSVLSYLYRTACKASPFSTFTGVAAGRFGAGAPGPVRLAPQWTSHPRLNVVVLMRLAEQVVAAPGLRDDLPVAPSPGWERDGGRVRFVRRSVTAGDDAAAVSFDAAEDRLFFLRRSGVLDRMLGLFERQPTVRLGELVQWLSEDAGAPPAEADRYAGALLELGLLQLPGLGTDVHEPDPLRAFQRALRSVGRPWASGVAERLEGPGEAVRRYAAADPPTRRRLLGELRRDLGGVQERLGGPVRLGGPERLGRPAATLPQVLLYEDVRAEADTAGCDRTAWTRLAADPLRSLHRILPVFDVALPQRLTFQGFFAARFGAGGRCQDLLRLVHDFHEDLFDQYLQVTGRQPTVQPGDADGRPRPEENWLGLPALTALDAARAELVDGMRARRAAAEEDAAELDLGEELVDAVADRLAPVPAGLAPYSHFVQLADRPGDPLVVLNNSYGGLGFPFTRFTHCLGGAVTDHLRRTLRAAQPAGAVFAEVTAGAATTNLNLHARLTDFEIVCPGETSSAPPEARLPLDDLSVEHDPVADRLRLRSRRLDREVVPLYLGYLVPMVLPEVPRTLLLLSPTSRAAVDVWRGVPAGPARDGVTARPRVRYRSLVLARRSWSCAAAALPGRPPGVGDAGWFLSWQLWRRVHGLPARVFATVYGGTAWSGGTKPQYVDFDSVLSLLALDGLLRDPAARVVLTEALPDADELHVRSDRGRHVAELALEVTG